MEIELPYWNARWTENSTDILFILYHNIVAFNFILCDENSIFLYLLHKHCYNVVSGGDVRDTMGQTALIITN